MVIAPVWQRELTSPFASILDSWRPAIAGRAGQSRCATARSTISRSRPQTVAPRGARKIERNSVRAWRYDRAPQHSLKVATQSPRSRSSQARPVAPRRAVAGRAPAPADAVYELLGGWAASAIEFACLLALQPRWASCPLLGIVFPPLL